MSGMVFPYQGSEQKVIDLVKNWSDQNLEIVDDNIQYNTVIDIDFLNGLVFIDYYDFFSSAYSEKIVGN